MSNKRIITHDTANGQDDGVEAIINYGPRYYDEPPPGYNSDHDYNQEPDLLDILGYIPDTHPTPTQAIDSENLSEIEKFWILRQRLHKGGHYAYLWICSEERNPQKRWRDAIAKRTIWHPVDQEVLNLPPPVDSAFNHTNVYFGVHPTNRAGTRYQRASKKPNEKAPHVEVVNCFYSEMDAKDHDPELMAVSNAYKEHLKQGRSPSSFEGGLSPAKGLTIIQEQIKALDLQPSAIVASGGGVQCYWFLSETINLSDFGVNKFSNLQEQFVIAVGGDTGAKDLARVLRVPATFNHKGCYIGGPLPVSFLKLDADLTYSLDQIKGFIKAKTPSLGGPTQPPKNPKIKAFGSQVAVGVTMRSNSPATYPECPETVNPSEYNKTVRALKQLSQARCDDFNEWIKVGMALYHEYDGQQWAFDLFNTWSKQSQKYDHEYCVDRWNTFGDATGAKLGLGSIIRWSNEDQRGKSSTTSSLSFDHMIEMANQFDDRKLLNIEIEDWVDSASQLVGGKLSKLVKVLRAKGLSIKDCEEWQKRVLETKKANKKKQRTKENTYNSELLADGLDDAGQADNFLKFHQSKYIIVDEWGTMFWDGQKWNNKGGDKQLFYDIRLHLRERITAATKAHDIGRLDADEYETWVRACRPSTGKIKAIMTQILSDPRCDGRPEDFDQKHHLLSVNNCVINFSLDSFGSTMPHDPLNMNTYCSPVDYNPNADVSLITDWLDSLDMSLDEQGYMQKGVGYTFSGWTYEECFFYLSGPPRAGKGLLMSLMRGVMGDTLSAEIDIACFTGKSNPDGQNFALAPLSKHRLIVAQETNATHKLSASFIKNITGGGEIYCAFKGKTHFGYKPKFKVWMTSNNPPKPDDVYDMAFWDSRLRWIRFSKSFLNDQDKGIKARFATKPYLEAFLLWGVQGAYYLQQDDGLTPPLSMTDMINAERVEQDYVQQWLDERAIIDVKAITKAKVLYRDYFTWCDDIGHTPHRAKRFKESLAGKGFVMTRTKSKRGIAGLRVVGDSLL